MYYFIFGEWYIWTIRPYPHSWMLYGVWGSGSFGLPNEKPKRKPRKKKPLIIRVIDLNKRKGE